MPLSHTDKPLYQYQSKLPLTHLSGDENDLSIKPFFHDNPATPTFIGFNNKSGIKNKGELFEFEHNTEVVYFDTKKDD